MMPRKVFYILAALSLSAVLSYSQQNPDKVSTQTNKQKVTVVVPSAALDERLSLIEGKVTLVYDGDTLSVETRDGKVYSIWLKGVDAPESKQNYGKKSRKALAELVEGKEVSVVVHKKGQFDRYIGNVYLNGEDIGFKQIEAGMAWHFKQYSYEQTPEERKKYAQAQAAAQNDRRGLWEDKEPVAPWVYRNEKADDAAKNEKSEDAAKEEKTEPDAEKVEEKPTGANGSGAGGDRKYILGPRGGCYYVSESGRKVYVKDKSLCAKP